MSQSDLRNEDLVAVTSHEMRAPLAAIRGFLDVLQRRRDELSEAEVGEFLDVISAQADRLIRLTDDLVTMTSLDGGHVAVQTEPVVLVPALEELVREIPDGHRVEIRVDARSPARIETDPLRLGQAVTNLLVNALKYSASDSSVTLELTPAGDEGVRISVIDEGVGIATDELDRVFELFYRTREGARAAEGSGLGLPITRAVVEALGGTVSTASTPGAGSAFSITLPRPAG
jgi:signal transduction histidine kinase